jgi:hypothetical protein
MITVSPSGVIWMNKPHVNFDEVYRDALLESDPGKRAFLLEAIIGILKCWGKTAKRNEEVSSNLLKMPSNDRGQLTENYYDKCIDILDQLRRQTMEEWHTNMPRAAGK